MGKLHFKVYRPTDKAVFNVSSTIVYGEEEAWLIDAQFQKRYAQELVEEIKSTGKKLTLVFVSHSDPDFYFGLDVVRAAFPDAKIVSTAQTAWLIRTTKDAKAKTWAGQLGADAPAETIVPQAITELPLLEGERVEIRRRPEALQNIFLWVPSERTILGGVGLTGRGHHPWLADTQSLAALDAWIALLEDEQALQPHTVVAGHWATHPEDGAKTIDAQLDYLRAYRKAVADEANGAPEIVAAIEAQFPGYADDGNLELGAAVVRGKAQWATATLYPGVGRHVVADFSPTVVFDLSFHPDDDTTMTFLGTDGVWKGYKDTVGVSITEVAPRVFMIYWQEANGMAVVHVQNWNTMDVWTNIYVPGEKHESYHMKGRLSLPR